MRTPLLASLLVGLACATHDARNAVASDPHPLDLRHPAALAEVTFDSAGQRLHGIVYEAQGEGPHPTVIVLHGLPGNERNLDLAQAARRSGWNAVFFHYRGAWGSEGSFSFSNALEDVGAVVAAVRAQPFADDHRVDPDRIALAGHSMGGFLALMRGSDLAAVDCVASIAGANLGAMAEAMRAPEPAADTARRLEAMIGPLHGTSGQALVDDVSAHASEWDTLGHAAALAEKPLLLVAGSRDRSVPPSLFHAPLLEALDAAGARDVTSVVFDSDHAFSDHRVALARALVDWLARDCDPARTWGG